MRLLLIEDDSALSSVLIRMLKEEAYAVDHAPDGQEGEWMAFENPYDAIILDLMLPIQDGLTVLKKLREGGITTPVLILTARDSTEDIVKGLDLGADDYLKKPFSVDELLARVRSVLRRKDELVNPTMKIGPLEINTVKKQASFQGQRLDLTPKEYALIEYLGRNADSVVSRTQLSEHVWDLNFEPSSNVVDVYIGYIRSKIDKAHGANMIKTIRGHGYMLDSNDYLPPVEKAASEIHPS